MSWLKKLFSSGNTNKTSSSSKSIEDLDGEKVTVAANHMQNGNLKLAHKLLLEVIANTPANYENVSSEDGTISIKFWNEAHFTHYAKWLQHHKAPVNLEWRTLNAYPRAYYILGYICVHLHQYTDAIQFLEKGQKLEPTNPKFVIEKGIAYSKMGEPDKALALLEQINQVTQHVSPQDLAIALRSRGLILIEKNKLDTAEELYKKSLHYDPNSKIAHHELGYIDHLRNGGKPDAVLTTATTLSGQSDLFKQKKSKEKQTKPEIIIDPNIVKKTPHLGAVWMGYALSHCNQMSENRNQSSKAEENSFRPTYEGELEARDTSLQIWLELKQKQPNFTDAYLDQLLSVRQAGFLPEYVWVFLRDKSWQHQPQSLRLTEFSKWSAQSLKNHQGQTLAYIKFQK